MDIKRDLIALSDFAWQRLRSRMEGLADEEFLWEPVPDCWTVRPAEDGSYRADGGLPQPEPPPFTTIAWRTTHLIWVLQAERTATWLGVRPDPADGEPVVPGTATQALDALDQAYAAWHRRLTVATADHLAEPMGEIAGVYATESGAGFVLHILDELIHHGAEIGVVRDLYRATRAEATR
ncbi:DinB family protein [Actinopolymorpha alba]|uniref:DinB family protein n=1 Tax=Actinopolymorpha alba TaxID=533267 RepID=UPI00035CB631|nr:DinB family protein [Actinopolymorpha alba]